MIGKSGSMRGFRIHSQKLLAVIDCGIGLVMIHELTNTTIGVKIRIQSWCGDVVGHVF
jgi:hypothetical protein